MENISVEDINFRLNKLKENVSKINLKIEENDKKNNDRFSFAKDLGIRVDILSNEINEVKDELDKYSQAIDNIIQKYETIDNDCVEENEYKLLNNMLSSDDASLKIINEMIEDNIELTTKEYINLFANKANELIRIEELKSIDMQVIKLSKISFLDKLTGKSKIKKAMIENCNLKRVQTINKNYIPEDKSLYEIVSIVNNCGYKSDNIDMFVNRVVDEFKLDNPKDTAIATIFDNKVKIPFFFDKELFSKINTENTELAELLNKNKKFEGKVSNYSIYRDMLKNGVETLELFKFEEVI